MGRPPRPPATKSTTIPSSGRCRRSTPASYPRLLATLRLTGDRDFVNQHDRAAWPVMRARLGAIFAGRDRDEWASIFAGSDACVTPVLSLTEAPHHPHNVLRGTFATLHRGTPQANPAPRFSGTPCGHPDPMPTPGADTRDAFTEAGMTADDIDCLIK